MKRLLITGFAPFGGNGINPAWQAVQALPETVGGWELVKREVPVTFRGAPQTLYAALDETEPDAVLMIGLAAGRDGITPERQAVNEMTARIPDNGGNQPQNEPVVSGGPEILYSTLPVEERKPLGTRVSPSGSATQAPLRPDSRKPLPRLLSVEGSMTRSR